MTSAVPVIDHLVLEIEEFKAICVGDLHIGLESEYNAKGVHVPSQTNRMERELAHLSEGKERLIIVGDVKNKVPGSTRQEYRELPPFFRKMLHHYGTVDLVRGNHDTNIEEFLPEGINVHPSTGFTLGDVGFAHGHTWPSPEVMSRKTLIIAHNHPSVALMDSLGNVSKEPCWVKFKMKDDAYQRYVEIPEEVIMMPAFNRSLGGSPVNIDKSKLLGPLFSEGMADINNAEVYLPDGIYLGTIESLRIQQPRRIRTQPKPESHKY